MRNPVVKIEAGDDVFIIDVSSIVAMSYEGRTRVITIQSQTCHNNFHIRLPMISEEDSRRIFMDLYTKFKNYRETELEHMFDS